MINAASFREAFPEFGSTTTYPDAQVNYWIAMAKVLLPVSVWGVSPTAIENPPTTEIDFGYSLFTAHNLALAQQREKASKTGAVPGLATGPINQKSVGPVSVSYDTQAAIELDASHWNMTTYGIQFISLARMMGAMPIQVGVGQAPFGSGGAWSGPWPWPLPGGVGFG